MRDLPSTPRPGHPAWCARWHDSHQSEPRVVPLDRDAGVGVNITLRQATGGPCPHTFIDLSFYDEAGDTTVRSLTDTQLRNLLTIGQELLGLLDAPTT